MCPLHGIFNQVASNHLTGQGCPICKESKGEKEIREFLTTNNVKFNHQHKFKDCKNILPLPFDFYLPEHNTCIEFNGRQHYEPIDYFGGVNGFKSTQFRDKIKYDYCKNNKITLFIIKDSFDKEKQEMMFETIKSFQR